MMRQYILRLTAVLTLFCASAAAIAAREDRLFLSDQPVVYGEESFIRRMHRRSEGSRPPLGLVLSGGSARAFAHIGVLRRLEEMGIVPDFIVTNSMGSIVGMLYAAGLSPDQIHTIVSTTDLGGLFDPAIPTSGGILSTGRFVAFIESFLGRRNLQDLPIPVMVICEDLMTKQQVRIAEGNFSTVLQAAFALPVYFNPVEYRDHLLIDGGISNIVPLGAAYRYSSSVISSTTFYDNPDLNLRNPLTILNVAMDITKSRKAVEEIKSYDPILIRCDVEQFSFMDFAALEELSSAGYESARAVNDEILAAVRPRGLGDLPEIRAAYDDALDDALRRYGYLHAISLNRPQYLVTGRLVSRAYPGSPYYLDTSVFAGVGMRAAYRTFSADLMAGTLFPRTALHAAASLVPMGRAAVGVTGTVSDDSIHTGSSLTAFLAGIGPFRFYLSAGGEAVFTPIDYRLVDRYFHGSLDTRTELETVGLDLSAGIETENAVDSALAFQGGISLSPFSPLYLASSALVRAPWPGRGTDVRYFRRDGFYGPVDAHRADRVLVTGAELGFRDPDLRIAIAELLLLQDLRVALYGQRLESDAVLYGSGVLVDWKLSFIGLAPFHLAVVAGFQTADDDFYWELQLFSDSR